MYLPLHYIKGLILLALLIKFFAFFENCFNRLNGTRKNVGSFRIDKIDLCYIDIEQFCHFFIPLFNYKANRRINPHKLKRFFIPSNMQKTLFFHKFTFAPEDKQVTKNQHNAANNHINIWQLTEEQPTNQRRPKYV